MLTPDYYDSCTDDIVNLYAQLDEAIVADIVRRIIKTGEITETAKWQIKQAQEMGLLYDDIISEIGRRTDATDNQVRALFEDAGVKSVQFDNQIYRRAGLVPVDIRQSPAMLQVLNAGYKKTLGNMKNLTLTTANTAQSAYYNACNLAYMKITSGAFSYQEAIRQAIKSTAEQGSTVLYPSGHQDKIDVAVRRAVLTGVGQTCRTISETNAIEMDCDLMELSAHSGARPSHAEWQGQLVSLSGRKGYLTKDDIGYGTGAGFGGYNCQHDWYPFYEGISKRNYTKADLDKLNAKDIEYNNKMYSEYEISQMLRKKEREIRALKREKVAYKTAIEEGQTFLKSDLTALNGKIKDKSNQIQEFCSQTGYNRDRFRELGGGKTSVKNYQNGLTSKKDSGKIKAESDGVALEYQRYGRNKNTLVNHTYIESGEYRRKFDKITDNENVNKTLYDKSKEALKHRSGTAFEDMYWIDSKTGKVILKVTDSNIERAIVYTERIKKLIKNETDIITLHTHPSSMPPSAGDFNSCFKNNYKQGFVSCHNGKIFAYTSNQEISENLYNIYIVSYVADGCSEFEAQLKAIDKLKENHMIDFWEVK